MVKRTSDELVLLSLDHGVSNTTHDYQSHTNLVGMDIALHIPTIPIHYVLT